MDRETKNGNTPLDAEWVRLVLSARRLGLNAEQVRKELLELYRMQNFSTQNYTSFMK